MPQYIKELSNICPVLRHEVLLAFVSSSSNRAIEHRGTDTAYYVRAVMKRQSAIYDTSFLNGGVVSTGLEREPPR